MSDDMILLWALPFFGLAMGVEFAWSRWRGRDTYRLGDTLSSLGQGLLSQVVAVCTRLVQTGLYAMLHPFLALAPKAASWGHWPGWVLAVLLYDFCDYWLHRVSHESAIFWAGHVVHHQSEHFNLSTALRQESFYGVAGWMFFLPMALVGVPPALFGMAGLVVLFYQFWIHTEHVGSLGVLDRIFSTPSNHRVHHAVNDRYLDRNYGAVLVVWDRLFGTFEPESEACVYGTRTPLRTWNPLSAVGRGYVELFARCARARGWRERLGVLFRSPSWQPPSLAAPVAEPYLLPTVASRYDPPVSAARRWLAVGLFLLAAAASALFLARADGLGAVATAGAAVLLVAALHSVGTVLDGRGGARRAVVVGLCAGLGASAVAWFG